MNQPSHVATGNRGAGRWQDVLVMVLLFLTVAGLKLPAATLSNAPPEYRSELTGEEGFPYMLEMDSYFYLRKAAEYDAQAGGPVPWRSGRAADPLAGALDGDPEAPLLLGLSVITVWLYRLLRPLFGVSLYGVAYWMGPVLSSTAVIPAYLYVRRLTNPLGGAAGALAVALSTSFFARTHPGFYDTDMMLAFLPMVFLLGMGQSMLSATWPKRLFWATVSALGFGSLSMFWSVYFVYFPIAFLSGVLFCILALLCPGVALDKNAARLPRLIRVLCLRETQAVAVCLALACLCVLLFQGRGAIGEARSLFEALGHLVAPPGSAGYPAGDVFVSELQPMPAMDGGFLGGFQTNLRGIVNHLGGLAITASAAGGMLLLKSVSPIGHACVVFLHFGQTKPSGHLNW